VKPLFYEMGMGYTQVAICVSEPNQNIYVTFRGTDIMEFPDVLANLNVLWDTYGPSSSSDSQHKNAIHVPGKVQRGWNRKIFNPELYLPLSEKLRQTKQKYPNYNIIVGGHSLGAALSILYGIYVAKYVFPHDPNIQVMNLGSPRVGDEEFYHAVQTIPNLKIWRMVYQDDVVPRCPPMWTGYRHVGHLLHWDSASSVVKAYHQQLESCYETKETVDSGSKKNDPSSSSSTSSSSSCYAGIQPKDWNILFGNIDHHEHAKYKCIVEQSKKKAHQYWPKQFEML
jgi:predicted lipase